MGMFYARCHSKWVHFQIPDTHIRALLYWSRPPVWNGHLLTDICDMKPIDIGQIISDMTCVVP